MTVDARLQRLLGGEPLAALRKRLRQRYARGAPADVLRLGSLSEAEHAALAALSGRPARPVRSMQIDVAEIDAALARPDAFADAEAASELGRERAHLAREIEQLEEEWLQLQGEIEALEQNRG